MILKYLLLVAVIDSEPLSFEPFTTWPTLAMCEQAGEAGIVFLRELGAGGTYKCRAIWGEPGHD